MSYIVGYGKEKPRVRPFIRVFVFLIILFLGVFSLFAYQKGVEDTCMGFRNSGYTVR